MKGAFGAGGSMINFCNNCSCCYTKNGCLTELDSMHLLDEFTSVMWTLGVVTLSQWDDLIFEIEF